MQQSDNMENGISIIPMHELGGLFEDEDCYGIFMDCGQSKMNIGTIMPSMDGTFFLSLAFYPEMGLQGIVPGSLTENFDSFDSALAAANNFIRSKLNSPSSSGR